MANAITTVEMRDTVSATLAFNKHMPPETERITSVNTFKDEPEQSLAKAREMKRRLGRVRLDTPFGTWWRHS